MVPGHHMFSPPQRQFVEPAETETSDEDSSFCVGGGAYEAAAG